MLGFEDLPNEMINRMQGDNDCNDVMFQVFSYPETAISYEIPEITTNDDDIIETEEVDAIQPLSNILDLPNDDLWNDLMVASQSTLNKVSYLVDNWNSYGLINGLHEENIIANTKKMVALIIQQELNILRTLVKTTVRKVETKFASRYFER